MKMLLSEIKGQFDCRHSYNSGAIEVYSKTDGSLIGIISASQLCVIGKDEDAEVEIEHPGILYTPTMAVPAPSSLKITQSVLDELYENLMTMSNPPEFVRFEGVQYKNGSKELWDAISVWKNDRAIFMTMDQLAEYVKSVPAYLGYQEAFEDLKSGKRHVAFYHHETHKAIFIKQ